ncbi:hypothetical protein V6Z11_A10G253000 [Gossypium hirsutum]
MAYLPVSVDVEAYGEEITRGEAVRERSNLVTWCFQRLPLHGPFGPILGLGLVECYFIWVVLGLS